MADRHHIVNCVPALKALNERLSSNNEQSNTKVVAASDVDSLAKQYAMTFIIVIERTKNGKYQE